MSSQDAWGKSRWYLLIGRWVDDLAILDVFGEAKLLLPLLEIEPQFLGCPCCSIVTILPTLYWLCIQDTGVILQLWDHLVFVFLLLVPFFPCLWHNFNSAQIWRWASWNIWKALVWPFQKSGMKCYFLSFFSISLPSDKSHAQGVHKITGNQVVYGGTKYLWVLSMKLAFVILQAPINWRWRLRFWKICAPLVWSLGDSYWWWRIKVRQQVVRISVVQNWISSVLFKLRPGIYHRIVWDFLYNFLRIVKRAC